MKRLLILFALFALLFPSVAVAQDVDAYVNEPQFVEECGPYWPDSGSFELKQEGDTYIAVMTMSFLPEEVAALQCVAPELRIDFKTYGFNVPGGWADYNVYTNLPGGSQGPAEAHASDDIAVPRYSGVQVADIAPYKTYYAVAVFSSLERGEGDPRVSFQVVSEYRGREISRVYLSSAEVDAYLYYPFDSFEFGSGSEIDIIEPD